MLLLVSPVAELHPVELGQEHELLLQRFFDANPAYFLMLQGNPASPNEARDEIRNPLPEGWRFRKKWLIGSQNPQSELAAVVNIVADLLAPTVWHIGLFMLATSRHGTGEAQRLYRALEDWAKANGAHYLRLGVVQNNARARRFWESMGYSQTRIREGIQFGQRKHTVCVMFKPLAQGTLAQYLSLVERDRPDV